MTEKTEHITIIEMDHKYIFPKIKLDKGTVLHGDGSKTMHAMAQTTVRKEGTDGKYYEWYIASRRSTRWLPKNDNDEKMVDLVTSAYDDVVHDAYAAIITGIAPIDAKDTFGNDLYPEWKSHPHNVSERDRVNYLIDSKQYR